ncbi:Elongator complex protein 5 [Echria macrotheca]|uniref:Elongator complex protein 5 n=1 Tax=Echria macrotheca TaxID=438768 RepID=A0AAJ0FB51_9PEZI|nr:Elongator complex protein 5 [Echria macrotheca]
MAPSAQAHQRSHSLLLLQKLLSLRDSASPLTLILDTLEQGAGPLVREFIVRAKLARSKIIFISLATVKKPRDADVFIKARGKPLKALAAEIATHLPPPSTPQKTLLILDTLNPLTNSPHTSPLLPAFLTSLLPSPSTSLLAIYHTDVPVPVPVQSEYAPHPLTLLTHLATTVLRVSSLVQTIAIERARQRSLPPPEWGLAERREGVLIGLLPPQREAGVVVDMEMRRRSGRSVVGRFILSPPPPLPRPLQGNGNGGDKRGTGTGTGTGSLMLLADHPVFATPAGAADETGSGEGQEQHVTTFSLGLTEKQRRDREGIVLPYFDAQTDIGGGEGGRILYDMDGGDDFDDEEDEI